MDENVAVDVRTGSSRSCPAWLLPSTADLSVTNRNEFLPRVMGQLILCSLTFICLFVSDTERQPREQRTLKADCRSKSMSLIVIWCDPEEDTELDAEDGAGLDAEGDIEENQEADAEDGADDDAEEDQNMTGEDAEVDAEDGAEEDSEINFVHVRDIYSNPYFGFR